MATPTAQINLHTSDLFSNYSTSVGSKGKGRDTLKWVMIMPAKVRGGFGAKLDF